MLFNTAEYIFVFLPLVLLIYFSLNRFHLVLTAKWWLALASIIFYSWWNLANLPILIISILCNWIIVNAIWRENDKKSAPSQKVFFVGLGFNLLYLGCFKYYDFVVASMNQTLGMALPSLHVELPLGISFFTLTQIAYLVDAKERLVKRQKFQNYALFVLFFPHLIIGPILHHKDMMPQFEQLRTKVFSLGNLASGMLLFSIGFAKKILIADPLTPYVKFFFDDSSSLGMIEAWQAALAFTCQLYFDFSGYVDMAIGSALMLNIRMPENFNSPLRAKSLIEFWSRWHMTLTNFLTTYIYTPILYSFKKLTFKKSLIAVFVTFFIAGIWHGAAWTFIIFGALHGTALTINHIWRRHRFPMPAMLGWLLTFIFVCCTLVIFRAHHVHDAVKIFAGMLGLNGMSALNPWKTFPNLADYSMPLAITGLDLKTVFLISVSMIIIMLFHNSRMLVTKFRELL